MDEDSRLPARALSLSGSIWSTDRTESADDDAEITTYADKYYMDEREAQSLVFSKVILASTNFDHIPYLGFQSASI